MTFRIHKQRGWIVKGERPEEVYGAPELYYTDDEVEKYARSGGMRKAQEKIAYKIIELLGFSNGRLLDLGCGVGYTASVYQEEGFDVVGLDVLQNMLEIAETRGVNTIKGDMRNLKKLFQKGEFDAVVSASALQWIKDKIDLKKVVSGIHYILKSQGKLIIQFYPRSEDELKTTAKIFKKNKFEGEIYFENPRNPVKRRFFLVMKKSV